MTEGYSLRWRALFVLLMLASCSSEAGPSAKPSGDDEDDMSEGSEDEDDTSDESEPAGDGGRARDAGRDARQDASSSRRDSGKTDAQEADDEDDVSGAGGDDATGGDGDVQMAPDQGSDHDVFFRIDKFNLRAPSFVVRVLGLETPIATDLQSALDDALGADANPADGNVDLSLLLRFLGTPEPAKEAGEATFGGAFCAYPVDSEMTCHTDPISPFHYPAVAYDNAEDCELAGTSELLSGPCFTSDPTRMILSLPLFGDILLDEAQMIGSWGDGDEAGIPAGWLRGFLPEKTAMTTTLQGVVPPEFGLLGIQTGTPLINFLPNGQRAMGSSGAGWWFQVEFAATPARFQAEQ